MKSLRNLYRIGHGPSSSHSIGPSRIAKYLREKYRDAKSVDVTLYGSLAFTGKGHLTDVAIEKGFSPIPCNVVFDYKTSVEFPNTLDVVIHFDDKEDVTKRCLSLGGGRISISGEPEEDEPEVYPQKNFEEVSKYCKDNNIDLADYVERYEGKEIWDYLMKVWNQMVKTIDNGLHTNGVLPGKLEVQRRASSFLTPSHLKESSFSRANRMLAAYAFATNEENAAGGKVVTAPTCGSAGTLPAVLLHLVDRYDIRDEKIIRALAVAGVIGNIVKQNGSISGAEAGCQAEIGTACSMAAAATSYLKGFSIDQIECAAEAAMEHSLGTTCDPVMGYVQIPCIERNAVAAVKALSATYLAEYASSTHRVSFDNIVQTMLETGKDLKKEYRETSEGGLAKDFKEIEKEGE
ncbi:MAG: L-serine ammonia-lyase, iron-sulfur-dependent, subunit alpha [Bacilli bacterium]|nr:L-serine ammonia-lyase, iron-sulfur-dependent, subunit alpha [Bacilli bacterium]